MDARPDGRTRPLYRLALACRPHRGLAFGTTAAAVVGVGSQALFPFVARVAVDDAVHGISREITGLVVLLAANAVLGFAASFARRYLGGRLSLEVQYDLRRAVFASITRFDGRRQDEMRTGQVVSRAVSDLQEVQGLLASAPLAVGYVALILVSLAAMVWLSPLLSVVALVIVPVSALLTVRSRRQLFPANWAAQQRIAEIAQHVEETVTGVRVVKGFGQEDREIAAFERRARRLFADRLRAARITSRLSPLLTVMPVLGLIAVFALGGALALRGGITLGTFLAFSTYISTLIAPVRTVGALVVSAQLAMAGIDRVYDLVDARPEVVEPAVPEPLPDGPLPVEFDGVGFRYEGGEPVLEGVSFTIAPGETVALIGAAGAGKSTLAQLLPRLYDPQDGEIRVGGLPLGRLALDDLRRELGVVFEEPFLFNDTVRANIAYARPDTGMDRIRDAARVARAEDFVLALPDGYDTLIGERGLTLSGGQRQRIALARALVPEPRILVLDDVTSAVDATTERDILEALRKAVVGRTTLLVARRRSTLALADRVVVLDHGRVTAIGTPDELERRGLLAGIVDDGQRDTPEETAADPARLWPSETGSGDAAESRGAAPAVPAAADDDPAPRDEPRIAGLDPTAPGLRAELRSLLRPVRSLVVLAVALILADAATTLVYPQLARFAVDGGIEARAGTMLAVATLLGVLVVAADWVVSTALVRTTARAAESVLYQLRVGSFARLQRFGLDFYEREPAGRIMTRMTTDVNALSTFLQTGLAQSASSLLTACGIMVALVVTAPELALAALIPVPVLLVVNWLMRSRVFRIYGEAREQLSAVNADLQENVSGLRTVQASVREEMNRAAFDVLTVRFQTSRFKAQRYIALFFPLIELISQASTVAVLAVGADRLAAGSIAPGVLTASLLYLEGFFGPLQTASVLFDGYQQAKVGLNRIGDLLSKPGTVSAAPQGPAPMPERLRGDVELRGVSYRYTQDGPDVLHAVDLRIRAGESVALVGTTGAGKSTLMKLLARFYDAGSGQVLVDGVDVRRYPLGGYRRRLGVVPQEAHLFTGDVAANIAYGRPDATREQIEQAARSVGALEMIVRLPRGFRQPVGERGQGLSAGQRQLLALARAELVDPDLVLLDEATAALDPVTEAAVVHATSRLFSGGRTTVVVAHRLATAARADRIVVLEAGRIVEQGTHRELLAIDGRYRALRAAADAAPEPLPTAPATFSPS